MKRYLFLLAAIFLPVYLWCLAPSVSPQGDSGEMVTVAYTLGVAHPPGYPLYTLLAHLFTWLPWGSVAWRVNLLSALLQTATLLILFRLLTRVLGRNLPAFAAVLLLGFSYTFWLYSEVAEVFSLNNFFAVLILYFAWKMAEEKKMTIANSLPLALFIGLGVAHHQTIVLIFPAVLYLVIPSAISFIKTSKPASIIRLVIMLAAATFLGFVPYAYFYWRAKTAIMPIAWSYPDTLEALWRLFIRADYGTFSSLRGADAAAVTLADKSVQVVNYFRFLLEDFGVIGMALSLVGLIWSYFKLRRWAIFCLLGFLFSGPLFLTYANFPIREGSGTVLEIVERFYLLPNIFLAMLMGTAVFFLQKEFQKTFALRYLIFPSVLLYSVFLFFNHLPAINQRGNFLDAQYGRNILVALPPRSLLIMGGDIPIFSVIYAHYVEGYRADVTVVTPVDFGNPIRFKYQLSQGDGFAYDWPKSATASGLVDLNFSSSRVFAFNSFMGDDQFVASPTGLIYAIYRRSDLPEYSLWREDTEKAYGKISAISDVSLARRQTIADGAILNYYSLTYASISRICLAHQDYSCAEKYAAEAVRISPMDIDANYLLARTQAAARDCLAARQRFGLVLDLNPNFGSVYQDLANLYRDCFYDESKAADYQSKYQDLVNRSKGNLKEL